MFKRKTLNVDVDVNATINTVEVQDRVCFDLRTKNGTYKATGDDAGLVLVRIPSRVSDLYNNETAYNTVYRDLTIPVDHLDAVIGLLAAARDKYNQAPEVKPEVV